METKHTHTSKLLEGLFRLPPVLTHKADRSTAIAPNVTMTQAWDGMLTVTLYDTVILQRVKSTTYVAHGGHQTATTMRWILSALEARGRSRRTDTGCRVGIGESPYPFPPGK
jgi:hypothetical protein